MAYSIKLCKKVRKQLQEVHKEYLPKIVQKIDALATNPRPPGVKKLSGKLNTYRVRQGPYRIIFQIRDQERMIIILSVTDRKDAYQ